MGGQGSGRRPKRPRVLVESVRWLDVNDLNRRGCLTPGWAGEMQWLRGKQMGAGLGLRAEREPLVASCRRKVGARNWQKLEEPILIERIPCPFGGTRPYFICPGATGELPCGSRTRRLYAAGPYFLCRQCYRLSYESQREGPLDRALRRANKIRIGLGGQPGTASIFPDRPRGMHCSTYDRLRKKAVDAETLVENVLRSKLARRPAPI